MRISVVSTLYRSEPFVLEFIQRSFAAVEQICDDVELVLIDDGSPDNSLRIAKAYPDPRITVVELSRNFGHHRALMEGLATASGDRVFLVDSDLEEPPELVVEFSKLMDASGADVVFGINQQSEGSIFRRWSSIAFWRVFNWASDSSTPIDICNVRLMKKGYADALAALPESNVFLGGLFHWVGFKQIGVPIDRKITRAISTYSFRSRLSAAARGIASFSTSPLKLMFLFGLIVAAASACMAVYFAVSKLLHPDTPIGFTALIISVWFFGGLVIACIGIVGVYIGYMYIETKGRPRVVIRKIHRGGNS